MHGTLNQWQLDSIYSIWPHTVFTQSTYHYDHIQYLLHQFTTITTYQYVTITTYTSTNSPLLRHTPPSIHHYHHIQYLLHQFTTITTYHNYSTNSPLLWHTPSSITIQYFTPSIYHYQYLLHQFTIITTYHNYSTNSPLLRHTPPSIHHYYHIQYVLHQFTIITTSSSLTLSTTEPCCVPHHLINTLFPSHHFPENSTRCTHVYFHY